MTKTQVADYFGWTTMYYGRFENGHILPSKGNIVKFATFLNIKTSELEEILKKEIKESEKRQCHIH